ncbi:MAG: hypothetical protein ACOYOF_18965 [Verrucomicrobiaceae bacterium]|jgi:hypothetical protein
MREEKLIVRILRNLATVVAEEASTNPQFADRLEAILAEVPSKKKTSKPPKPVLDEELPDPFVEAKARTASEFELWLRDLEIPVLKALVRKHDLDSSKKWQKWQESEKFAKLISDQIQARMQRGSAFMTNAD